MLLFPAARGNCNPAEPFPNALKVSSWSNQGWTRLSQTTVRPCSLATDFNWDTKCVQIDFWKPLTEPWITGNLPPLRVPLVVVDSWRIRAHSFSGYLAAAAAKPDPLRLRCLCPPWHKLFKWWKQWDPWKWDLFLTNWPSKMAPQVHWSNNAMKYDSVPSRTVPYTHPTLPTIYSV